MFLLLLEGVLFTSYTRVGPQAGYASLSSAFSCGPYGSKLLPRLPHVEISRVGGSALVEVTWNCQKQCNSFLDQQQKKWFSFVCYLGLDTQDLFFRNWFKFLIDICRQRAKVFKDICKISQLLLNKISFFFILNIKGLHLMQSTSL